MSREELGRLERLLLVHLLDHRGNQVRFEADQWTTEFGIARKFASEDPAELKNALRALEMSRMIYRRTQYVVGYSEPKHVLSLTAAGHRTALEVQRVEGQDGPLPIGPFEATVEDGPVPGPATTDRPDSEPMPVVEGKSVRLRPLLPSDYPTVYTWFRDPEIVAPYDRYFADTYEGFARSLSEPSPPPESLTPRFGVEPIGAPGLVGVVGHYAPHPVLESTEVWYVIGEKAARGHGFGREAVGLLVEHLWSTSSIERVGITCDVENLASCRLAEGLGFRPEGTLRSAFYHHARWHDVQLYGVTRAEWSNRAARG